MVHTVSCKPELYEVTIVCMLPAIGGGLCAIVRFSSGAIMFFWSDSTTGG